MFTLTSYLTFASAEKGYKETPTSAEDNDGQEERHVVVVQLQHVELDGKLELGLHHLTEGFPEALEELPRHKDLSIRDERPVLVHQRRHHDDHDLDHAVFQQRYLRAENKDQPEGWSWVRPPCLTPPLLHYVSRSSHLIVEIQVHESGDALGELGHFSHRFHGAWLAAVEEAHLQPLRQDPVRPGLTSAEICGSEKTEKSEFSGGWLQTPKKHKKPHKKPQKNNKKSQNMFGNLWPKLSYKTAWVRAQPLVRAHELITNWVGAPSGPMNHGSYLRRFYFKWRIRAMIAAIGELPQKRCTSNLRVRRWGRPAAAAAAAGALDRGSVCS